VTALYPTPGSPSASARSTSAPVASYGTRRVPAELRHAHGVRIGRKRVERLMQDAGLSGLIKRRRLSWRWRSAFAPSPLRRRSTVLAVQR